MKNNEIECWALQIVADSDEIRKTLDEEMRTNPYFVGIHIAEEGEVLMLYSDQVERNKAYTRLNKGGEKAEDIIVALILPPCYVDKKYLKQN